MHTYCVILELGQPVKRMTTSRKLNVLSSLAEMTPVNQVRAIKLHWISPVPQQ